MLKMRIEWTNVEVNSVEYFDNIETFELSDAMLSSDASFFDLVDMFNKMLLIMGYDAIELVPIGDENSSEEALRTQVIDKVKKIRNDN